MDSTTKRIAINYGLIVSSVAVGYTLVAYIINEAWLSSQVGGIVMLDAMLLIPYFGVREFKKACRVRYVGITTTFPNQYAQLIDVMRNEPLDFIGVDYAADNRDVEEVILPLAIEKKIAVLAYAPFGRTSLFRRAAGKELPAFAKEFDATTWAQFFLKFTLSHPAITAVTPATSQAKNMLDNIGGGIGRLPTAAHRKQIIEFVDALPALPGR